VPDLRFLDMLQEYPFHVFDMSGYQGDAANSVFDPVLGFSACTTPEWTVTTREVKPGNAPFTRYAVQSAVVGPITLSRGVRWYDSDFYNWLLRALKGIAPVRRDLFLVHFFGWRPTVKREQSAVVESVELERPDILQQPKKRPVSGGIQITRKTGGLVSLPPENGLTALTTRIPARCWYMRKCIPTGYKPGGDFDANSANVSIATLTIQPGFVDEVTVSTISPTTSRAFSTSLAIADLARL